MNDGFAMRDSAYFEKCISGAAIYGDDFSQVEIDAWYDAEKEGYANLGAKNVDSYVYEYHALNDFHFFSRLPKLTGQKLLGIGSAWGHELTPIAYRFDEIVILDPSDQFDVEKIGDTPTQYQHPNPTGKIDFPDFEFDAITSFGVMHHIPNVTFVMQELYRVLKPGGVLLLREPIVSMGDWRKTRNGLTANERGLPYKKLQALVAMCGFSSISDSVCDFSLTPRIYRMFGTHVYNSKVAVAVDALAARAFSWNKHYNPTSLWQRLQPTSCAMILQKPRQAPARSSHDLS
jgi:SAM-dependent methyltransferase